MTDRTTVTWTITDADGNPLANRMVYATLVAGVGGGSVDSLVVAERATARTDADGIATFSLWPNEAIDPDGTYYAFTADFARPPIVRYVEVPTSASPVEVADLDAVEPVTVGGFVPAPSSGDAFDVLRLRADGAAAEWAAPSGGGVSLSGDAPKALGTVAAGVGTEASRSDHVHPMPSPSDVGATPTTRTLAGLDLSADRSASALRTALSLVPGTDVQAYDADLAAIAALTTTTYGRSLLELASASALRAQTMGLGTAPFPTGNWYVDQHQTNGSRAVAAGYLTFFPITTDDPVTIDALAVMVKTGHASGAGHLYLVSSDPATGRPSTSSTVLAYAANVGATSSTTRVAAALNTAVTKTAGTMWAAWHCIAGPPTLLAVNSIRQWGPPITAPTVYATSGYTGVYASGGGTSTTPLTNLSGLTFQSDINQAPIIQWRAA